MPKLFNFSPLLKTMRRIAIFWYWFLMPVIVLAESPEVENTLKMVETTLQAMQQDLSTETKRQRRGHRDKPSFAQRFSDLKPQILLADEQIEADFAAQLKELEQRNLPPGMINRHIEAVNRHRSNVKTMLDYLDRVITTTDSQQQAELIEQGLTYLETLQPKKHVPVDPEQLAFNLSKPIDREPFETQQQFQQFFSLPIESAQETGPRTRAGSRVRKKSAPPSPADLVETQEVQLTDEIRALAESLGHQPVKIFNWVHDNIEYLPAHGSIQGAQLTLDMKRGNAFDTASLLIALLRASNIEARYVYGTVQISIERVMKWLKVDTPNAAVELLAGAAIPHGISVVGGAIKAVKLEHLWVDAWIDYRPSRGARHRKGDSWVPMDASFKQHTLTNGINLLDEVPFDIEGLRDYLIETTDTNESGGVMGIEQWYLKDLLTNYQTQLQDYVETHNVQPEDVLDRYAIIPSRRPYFAAGLPYRRIAKLETFTEIPARYRHSLTIKFYHSAQSQTLDDPAVSYTLNLPRLGKKRLSVTYDPATQADAQALENFWASGAESLPVYLFQVKPVIKLDDTVLATGTAIGMGEPQYYRFTVQHPHTSYTHNAQATAGDVIAFGINGNGITKELVQKRLETVSSDTAEENMHQVGLHFWMERDWFDELAAQVYQVRRQRMPSVGAFSLPLSVRYFFGIPRSGIYQSRQVDVKHNIQVVIAETNEARFNFMTQSGMHGSYIEGSVLDQLFGQQRQPAISASQLLMEAGHQNIPIYTITAENVNTILPILNVSQEVKSDIIHAVNSGRQAIVPEQELVHGNWTGSGYILQDLITGSGAYLLEGGYNGGGHGICFTSRKPPAMGISALSSAAAQQKMVEAFNLFFSTWASILAKIVFSDFEYPSEEAKKGVMTAARNLATMVNQLVDETLGTSHGCLMIFANDINKEEIYVPFERDEQSGVYKDSVTVNFTNEVPDNCFNPQWDFGDNSTSTDINPAPHIYSKTGKYIVTLTANCQMRNDELIPEIVKTEVYVSKVELEVREKNHPENWIVKDDPRRTGDDKTVRNKLLVWHNGDNSISFEVVKPDKDSVFFVEVIGTGGLTISVNHINFLNPELPIFEKLTQASKSFENLKLDHFPNLRSDFIVRYGLDHNRSGSLSGDEIHGEYEIYGLIAKEYERARSLYNTFYLPLVLFRVGNALYSRFANGVFPEPDIFGDYRPDEIKSIKNPSSYETLTHQCGAHLEIDENGVQDLHERIRLNKDGTPTLDEDGNPIQVYPDAIPGKTYLDSKMTYPAYIYGPSSDAAHTLLGNSAFIEKVTSILKGKKVLSYEKLDNLYPDGIPICEYCEGWKEISYGQIDQGAKVNLSFWGNVALGTAGLHIDDVKLYVRKETDYFYITAASVTARVTDNFDYNYFKRGDSRVTGVLKTLLFYISESSMSAVTIQCGFMKDGRLNDGTGQAANIQINTGMETGWLRLLEPIKVTK